MTGVCAQVGMGAVVRAAGARADDLLGYAGLALAERFPDSPGIAPAAAAATGSGVPSLVDATVAAAHAAAAAREMPVAAAAAAAACLAAGGSLAAAVQAGAGAGASRAALAAYASARAGGRVAPPDAPLFPLSDDDAIGVALDRLSHAHDLAAGVAAIRDALLVTAAVRGGGGLGAARVGLKAELVDRARAVAGGPRRGEWTLDAASAFGALLRELDRM
jgi:hypothetical protein